MGFFRGSRIVPEKAVKYPKAIIIPGMASGAIERISNRPFPLDFVRARTKPIENPKNMVNKVANVL